MAPCARWAARRADALPSVRPSAETTARAIEDAFKDFTSRDDIAVLLFPDVAACARLAGLPADTKPADVVGNASVHAEFQRRLTALAKESQGSSTRICRALLLEEPPSLDAGEATDKGSINQRAVLGRRAALVEELYAKPYSARVISIEGST